MLTPLFNASAPWLQADCLALSYCMQGYAAAALNPAGRMFSQGAASGSANSLMGRPGLPAGQQAPAAAPVSQLLLR